MGWAHHTDLYAFSGCLDDLLRLSPLLLDHRNHNHHLALRHTNFGLLHFHFPFLVSHYNHQDSFASAYPPHHNYYP